MNQEILISDSIKDQVPDYILTQLAGFSAAQQSQFVDEFKRKARNPTTALILAILGLHYFYLNKFGMQALFWITLGGIWIWWIIDLFRIKSIIKDQNKDVAIDIMRSMKAVM